MPMTAWRLSFPWPRSVKILDRYVLVELFKPFFFGILGFILLMLSVTLYQLTDLIFVSGAPVGKVVLLLLYNLPRIVVLAFPFGYLLSTLLGLGRMAKDFEIVALRSNGVTFKRIIAPIMVGAVLISIANFAFDEGVVPWANRQSTALKQDLAEHIKPPIQPNVFFQGTQGRYFYVKGYNPRKGTMRGIFILDQTEPGSPQIITAKTARWMGSVWVLHDGVLHKYAQDGTVEREIGFKALDIRVVLDSAYFGSNSDASEQSASQLNSQIASLKRGKIDTHALQVALFSKYSLPLATFFAALIAAPLALMFSRIGAYIGVALAIILVFLYYVTMQTSQAMGNAGFLPPFFAAWMQNLIFGAVGLGLLARVDR